jgi:hypothetical protein
VISDTCAGANGSPPLKPLDDSTARSVSDLQTGVRQENSSRDIRVILIRIMRTNINLDRDKRVIRRGKRKSKPKENEAANFFIDMRD